jgi:hypothetical protein
VTTQCDSSNVVCVAIALGPFDCPIVGICATEGQCDAKKGCVDLCGSEWSGASVIANETRTRGHLTFPGLVAKPMVEPGHLAFPQEVP